MFPFAGMPPGNSKSSIGRQIANVEDTLSRLTIGLNGLLELPDLGPDGVDAIRGNVQASVALATFTADGVEAFIPHGLGFVVRNALCCDLGQPFVLGPGATDPNERGLYRRAYTLYDSVPTALTTFPFDCRFLVWGARPDRRIHATTQSR